MACNVCCPRFAVARHFPGRSATVAEVWHSIEHVVRCEPWHGVGRAVKGKLWHCVERFFHSELWNSVVVVCHPLFAMRGCADAGS